MRKLILLSHVSLDGVIQGPGGPFEDPSGDFSYGGWSAPLGDETLNMDIMQAMSDPFDLLLGRRTYEIWAAYWPYMPNENPIASAINQAAKYIATRTLTKLDWKGSQIIEGDLPAAIADIKSRPGPPIHIWGSSELAPALISHDLIDELRLYTYPVILGTGKRLFGEGVGARTLTLTSSVATPNGNLINTYRPAGPVKSGSHIEIDPTPAELERRTRHAREHAQTR